MTLDEFKLFLEKVFRPSLITDGGTKITYTIEDVKVELDVSSTHDIFASLATYSKNEAEIFLPTHYEILVKNNTRIHPDLELDYSCKDVTNKINYKIGKPSKECYISLKLI